MADRNVTVRLSATADTSGITTFQNALTDVGTKSNTAGGFVSGFTNAVSSLDSVLGTSFSSIRLTDVIDWAEDLNKVGMQMNLAEDRFNNFFDSLDQPAPEFLQDLRKATMGIIDDLTLMTTANRFMQMGLASSGEEVASLLEMIVRIKDPMYSTQQAFESFALMMANSSVLRLDTFGINPDKVRARILELKETMGMGRQEAFMVAAMEGAQDTLARLGDSADAAGTAFGRLQTKVQNAGLELSQGFATAVEGLLRYIEAYGGYTPEQQAAEEAFDKQAAEFGANYGGAFMMAAMEAMNPEQFDALLDKFPEGFSQAIAAGYEAVLKDPSILANREALANVMFDIVPDWNAAYSLADAFLQVYNVDYTRDMQQAAAEAYDKQRKFDEMVVESGRTAADFVPRVGAMSISLEQLTPIIDRAAEKMKTLKEGIDFGENKRFEEAQISFSEFMREYGAFGQMEMPAFMSEADASAIADRYEEAREELERMQGLAADGLIDDEQLRGAEKLVDELGEMSQAADEAAKKFADLDLAMVLGQTEGGIVEEIKDKVLDPIKETLSETELLKIEDAFGLRSGAETESSIMFRDRVISFISANIKDPAVAAEIAFAVQETFKAAALQGIDTSDVDFMTAFSDALTTTDFSAEGDQFDPTAFLEDFQSTRDVAAEIGDNARLMGDHLQDAAESMTELDDKAKDMGNMFGPAETSANKLGSALRDLASKPIRIQVSLDLVDPGGLLRLLGGAGALNAAVAEATRAEGGKAPGVKNR